jgi:PAS domain S-box-containing protein
MLHLYFCTVEQHDLRLVALAVLICIFACGTSVDLMLRARRTRRRLAWSAIAAIVFGAGVWATHFVAELAYLPGFPRGYDLDLTGLSLAIAILVSWLGIAAAAAKGRPLLGGALIGGAIAAMHYVGMAALRVPAELHWAPAYVAASLVLGALPAAAALRLLWSGSSAAHRIGAGLLLVLAIAGLHFVAMAAVTLVPDPGIAVPDAVVAPELLAVAIAGISVLIVALGLSGLAVDSKLARRAAFEAARLRLNEARLRRNQQHLALAQQLAHIGSMVYDACTDTGEWSTEVYRILGIVDDGAPARFERFSDLVHAEDRRAFIEQHEAMMRGERRDPAEYRIVRPDGETRIIRCEAAPLPDEPGLTGRLLVTCQDVTELRQSEGKQRDLERQLQHAQKLEALGTLAGGIAHDLNNTLVPVLGLAKLTMKRLPEASRERANLATILQAGERARDLVRQILAFSRKDAPHRQPVDLAALARDSLKMLAASLPATIRVEQIIEDAPLVLADPSQIHQVLINLVVNAAQAIGDGMGRITVRLGPAAAAASETSGDVAVRLSVSDTGGGMDQSTLARIFEPFFTTKPVGEGTGLGLSVVHGIVAQHGGRVAAESRLGFGTRFDVDLPALSREEEAQHLERAAIAV